VAVRVIGNQVSVLLSDIGPALDYPLAEQILDYLEIPVPDEEDLDQVLPVGDLSIFADLGLDEMDLAAICSRLDSDSDDDPWDHVEDAVESIPVRLGFGPAMERALDTALGHQHVQPEVAESRVRHIAWLSERKPSSLPASAQPPMLEYEGLVPSVNVVVVNNAGEILMMIRRTDNGNWAVPAGAVGRGPCDGTQGRTSGLVSAGIC